MDFYWRGRPDMDLDGQGNLVPVLDANGDIVWWEVPEAVARFSSEVSYTSGTDITFTYSLENLGDESLDYAFPSIPTPSQPTGWSGNVASQSTATVSYTTTDENVWRQRSQGEVEGTDVLTWRPVAAYVPESELEFNGNVVINSVTNDPIASTNTITFQLSGEDADEAYIYRESSTGLALVDQIVTGVPVGVPQTVTDADYLVGDNTYRVHAGKRVNGRASNEITIENN